MPTIRLVLTEAFSLEFLVSGVLWVCADDECPLIGRVLVVAATAVVSALLAIGAYVNYKYEKEA